MPLTERRYHHRTMRRGPPEVPVDGARLSLPTDPTGATRQDNATGQDFHPDPIGEDESPVLHAKRNVLVLVEPFAR